MENRGRTTRFDEMVEALGHVQRRNLLVALLEENPQDTSPEAIAGPEVDDDTVERIVTMNHVHLPKLEASGFVGWNREDDEVVKGPAFDEIRPLLELLVANEDDLPDGLF